MIKFIEELLHSKTKDSQSDILLAQWSYDKKLIPSALHSVSNLFPHYSLHDESHSITIINNIVRVLGKENMERLSAIDLWLLLEASYCHDIGMVVTNEKLVESLSSPLFIEFINELIQDEKNVLHEFVVQYVIVDNKIRFKNDLFDFKQYEGIKYILAEFFRKIHSDRSKDIINSPLLEVSLVSPRGIIPARIFKILGNICYCHTKDFSEVLKLPYSEVGIDIEDAHPRFIACLLRIGDLLDLDNNRFSEVMLNTLTKVPNDTLIHKSKHLSIESFRVDKNCISIKAKCDKYETASITQHWFTYLNSEISQQVINWNRIAPLQNLGSLPTIEELKVELNGYETIDGKNKPKFSVDTDKALNLLQGAGIYEGAYQCIREILQNAVDATLIRIFLEHNEEVNFNTPQSINFIGFTERYPISVSITKNAKDEIWQNWEIVIEDMGIGISKNDLKYLMNTGSSSKNRERLRVIETMPTWMRPSGSFGIGFQSIFMLTDVVTIETKSFFTEEFQKIEFNSPNSIKDGDILIQKKKTNHKKKPGVKMTINYRTKAIPERYSVGSEHRNAYNISKKFDPFTVESLDIEIYKIIDEILIFNTKSYIPVNINIDKEIVNIKSEKTKFEYFDSDANLEFNISNRYCEPITNGANIYYKNQNVEHKFNKDFINLEINIHNNKASDILTLNRNKIKTEYEETLEKLIFKSSYKLILNNFNKIFQTEESKIIGSMYLDFYSERDELKGFNIKEFNQWENFEIQFETTKIKIVDLLKTIEYLKIVCIFNDSHFIDQFKLEGNVLEISVRHEYLTSFYTKFFIYKVRNLLKSIISVDTTQKDLKIITYSKESQENIISDNAYEYFINELKANNLQRMRSVIPCKKEYYDLRIKEEAHAPYIFHFNFLWSINFEFPKMLSPYNKCSNDNNSFRYEIAINDKLINWVYENRYDKKTTKEQIEKAYDKFCLMYKFEELFKEPIN